MNDASNEKAPTLAYQTVTREQPSHLVGLKYRVLGSVWTVDPESKLTISQLCMVRAVERFSEPENLWQSIEWLDLEEAVLPKAAEDPVTTHQVDIETLEEMNEVEAIGPTMSEYELKRRQRIRENNRILRALGLMAYDHEHEEVEHSEARDWMRLSHASNLVAEYDAHEDDVDLVFVPHIDYSADATSARVQTHRRALLRIAEQAAKTLKDGGYLVVGARDWRDPSDDRLWPVPLLVHGDLAALGLFVLKEIVVLVPQGYSKSKTSDADHYKRFECHVDAPGAMQHLDLVHVEYLVFVKMGAASRNPPART